MENFQELMRLYSAGLKDNTKETYRNIARIFAEYLQMQGIENWRTLEQHHTTAFLEHLRRRAGVDNGTGDASLTNRTARKYLTVIKSVFASYQQDPTIFDLAIARAPVSKKPQKRRIGYVKFDKIQMLFDACKNTKPGKRNAAFMALGFGGGMRISECLNLRMGDLKRTEKGTFFAYLSETKAGVPADQAIMPALIRYIEIYRDVRVSEGATPFCPFLTSYDYTAQIPTNNRIAARRMQEMFEVLTRSVLGERLTTHSMRATAISKLWKLGVPGKDIQHFARHSDIQTTEGYCKLLFEIDESPILNVAY